jgi:phenylpyruvate tautomerase PptA (4-oxalocrotonate tautomerase family)
MSQIKVYGIRDKLAPIRELLSSVIHNCVVEALQFPVNKKAHRFFLMDKDDFFYPAGRTEAYTIIEISMIAGRSIDAKKNLIKLLFENILEHVGIAKMDIEICIQESPAHDWGFRGMHGDEIKLDYKITV